MTDFIIYSCLYGLFIMGLLYPPKEFVSAGLTISELFSPWLGQESDAFIQYHIKRSIITLLVHSLLPFGYVVGLTILGHLNAAQLLLGTEHPVWLTLTLCSLIGPIFTLSIVLMWSNNDWSKHPIAKSLAIYAINNETWMTVASNINREFRSISKLQISTNTVTKVVVTDTWIMQVSAYKLDIAYQLNSHLVCFKVNVYPSIASSVNNEDCAYVKYKVCTGQPGGNDFMIRLNYNDVENFKGKVTMQITTLPSCSFPKKVIELYMDWIKEEIAQNPEYIFNQELDNCSVCINAKSNVKLIKNCPQIPSIDGTPACESCFCPPRSCVNCLVKWFITSSTLESLKSIEDLIQQKGSCPQCRSTFCIRDICYVRCDQDYESTNSN